MYPKGGSRKNSGHKENTPLPLPHYTEFFFIPGFPITNPSLTIRQPYHRFTGCIGVAVGVEALAVAGIVVVAAGAAAEDMPSDFPPRACLVEH